MTDKEKLIKIKKLADAMYYAAFNLTTDASLLRKAMNEYHQFIVHEYHKEEPISEDLKEIAWNHADKKCHLDIAVFTSDEVKKEREKMQFTWQDLYDAVMFGAKWQKEQIKEALLSEVLPCFMHGGEADEVVAKLDEVLKQK